MFHVGVAIGPPPEEEIRAKHQVWDAIVDDFEGTYRGGAHCDTSGMSVYVIPKRIMAAVAGDRRHEPGVVFGRPAGVVVMHLWDQIVGLYLDYHHKNRKSEQSAKLKLSHFLGKSNQ